MTDQWIIHDTYRYYICSDVKHKIAFFDLDETLITSYRGMNPQRFNSDPNDWIYLGDVPNELVKLKNEGYSIVIVTNQSKCKGKYEQILQSKFEDIRIDLEMYGLNVSFLISTDKDIYRKPNIGLFELFFEVTGYENIEPESFMCGDAAYEVDREGEFPAYDWSSSDLDFAKNCGLDFKRPNEIFKSNSYDFSNYDVLILVGTMGSGKSSFARSLKNFYHLENDTYKSNNIRVHKKYMSLLGITKIVFDATNPTEARRAEYYEPALKKGLKVAIVWFIRNGRPWNTLREKPVKEQAYSMYVNRFEIPSGDVEVYRMY